jgi:hypothetical protein
MSFKNFIKEENSDITIFFDMDGTIADFIGKALEHNPQWTEDDLEGQTIPDDKFWKHIIKIPNFWETLEPIKNGMEMLKYASDNGYNVEILTAHSSNDHRSIEGKKVWIKKHLSNFNISNIHFEKKKGKHAHSKAILVDDLDKNLKEFKNAGGKILKIEKNKTKITELKKVLKTIK